MIFISVIKRVAREWDTTIAPSNWTNSVDGSHVIIYTISTLMSTSILGPDDNHL